MWPSPVFLNFFLFVLKFVTRFLFPFLMSLASWLRLITSTCKLTLALEVFPGLTLIAAARSFFLFGLILILTTPVLLLALLYAVRLLMKVSNFFPNFSLVLFMLSAWFFLWTLAKFPMMLVSFILIFSGMFEKHVLVVLLSNSIVDDCSSWRFYGLRKSEGVFRLTSVEVFCNVLFNDLICHNGSYYFY